MREVFLLGTAIGENPVDAGIIPDFVPALIGAILGPGQRPETRQFQRCGGTTQSARCAM
jgi:hypothetical protein